MNPKEQLSAPPDSGPRIGLAASLVFAVVRRLERMFSRQGLYRIMAPMIFARVALKRARPVVPLPACLGANQRFQISRRRRRNNYLSSVLEFFPERLATVKWRDCARFSGLEYLEAARGQRRPVVLAFCHFGPYFLLRFWLRAAGFPAATLVEGESRERSALKRLKDRVSPFPEIPTAFYHEDQLREVVEFVAAGNPLLVAVDVLTGKQAEAAVDEGWRCGLATGAIRMAIRQRAELIPCSITDEDGWNFQIKLGPPVPTEILQSGDSSLIAQALMARMLPELRRRPDQCSERLIKRFRPMVAGEQLK